MTVMHWFRAAERSFASTIMDPIEQSPCVIRLGGLATLLTWGTGAARVALSAHPHLRAIGESGGGIIAALGGALGAKRWAQGNRYSNGKGPPGTDVEDHP